MIDFAKKIADRNAAAGTASASNEQPKAQLWLNVGYYVNAPTTENPEAQKFISLPMGIPLDTMTPAKITGSNKDFIAMRSAQNELLQLLTEAGFKLPEGGDELVNLQIQIRRVNAAPTAADSDTNPYSISDDFKSKVVGSAA